MTDDMETRRVRAMFLSDFHLGTRGAQAEAIVEFLRRYDAEMIYLVGDIVDGWHLKSRWYWPQSHNDVVQKLLRKARKGAKIIYLPGNHDEFLRDYCGSVFGGIEIVDRAIHETADGKRMLVIHGDQFDLVVVHAKWLATIGDWAYTFALWLNTYFNFGRRKMGLSYWSLSAWAKMKVKNAVNFIGRFEEVLVNEARRINVDGVICGHIHCAALHDKFGIRYANSGDWVESCTALVEHEDGRFEIITFREMQAEQNQGAVSALPVAAE
jgi:UDP-2,3-diacylglucosamine pyrophosphatase LpxH